jgi:hypothetical protein
MENIFFRSNDYWGEPLNNDTLHDPIQFVTVKQVCDTIENCQAVLEDRLSKVDSQVAGYPASGRGSKREVQSLIPAGCRRLAGTAITARTIQGAGRGWRWGIEIDP